MVWWTCFRSLAPSSALNRYALMINDTKERLFIGPRPSLGERASVRYHGQASRGVTAVRGDVRAELGVPFRENGHRARCLRVTSKEGMLRCSLLFFGSGLSGLVVAAASTSNAMQRAKMELRTGRGEL